jgi:death on curing protein
MHYFDIEEILFLHFKIIEDYGGSHGIRDEGRIEAVRAAPRQEVFGEELYPSVFEKTAVYLRSIIGDHAFVDGNKRGAVTVMTIFLKRNGYKLTATPKELEDFAVQVAVEHLDVPFIAAWLKAHSKKK